MLELVQTSPWAWSALCILLGLIAGGLQAGGWRMRLSNDLLGEQERLRLLETKSEHQRFGISDLKLRIRSSQREAELLRTDLKLLRSTYTQLDEDLRGQWDSEINLKSALVTQQADNERLHSELADWKSRISKLQEQLDDGSIDEAQLKKELTLGITAVCEHNNSEMTAVQELLRDCASQIDAQTIEREPQKVIGLLAAKVELLEGQMAYWQDLVIANEKAALAEASEPQLELGNSDSDAPDSTESTQDGAQDSAQDDAESAEAASLGNARDAIAEKTKNAREPKRSKRKRRNKRKQLRNTETAANDSANQSGTDVDPKDQPKTLWRQA